jgi:hypothetical protein
MSLLKRDMVLFFVQCVTPRPVTPNKSRLQQPAYHVEPRYKHLNFNSKPFRVAYSTYQAETNDPTPSILPFYA